MGTKCCNIFSKLQHHDWLFWHKRHYHMYSDVIFGWVVWIWLNSWHFVSDSLIFFLAIAWKFAGRHAGPPLPLLRPSSALRASSGLRSGNGGPACQHTFAHSALFSQNLILSAKKSNLSAKTNLSANGNLFILIIVFFFLYSAPE